MKPVAFDLEIPVDLKSANALLSVPDGDTKVIAGGQSLGPMLNLRLARPDKLIALSGSNSLRVTDDTDAFVSFGAAIRHAEIEDREVPDPSRGMMPHVASGIAYRAVRNKGTLGGSLCHADPAADWITTMTALDATMVISTQSAETRTLPMTQFMQGAYRTALGSGEILKAVRVPKYSSNMVWGYYKICRKVGEFADAIAAWVADPDTRYSRVVFGAGAGVPLISRNLASKIAQTGQIPSLDVTKEDLSIIAPELGSVKKQLFSVALQRCVRAALSNE